MEIRQLIYFTETARLQHMTEASAVLNVAQSALSRQISLLESDLGIRLFRREGRNIILTEDGRDFYEDAVKILEIVDRTKAKITENRLKSTQSMNIHITKSDMTSKILHTFQDVLKKHTDVDFNIESLDENTIEEKLNGKSLDIAISTQRFQSRNIKSALLFDQSYYYIFRGGGKVNLPVKASMNELEDFTMLTMDPVLDMKSQFRNATLLNMNDIAIIQHLLIHHPYIAILTHEECRILKHYYPNFTIHTLEHLNVRQPLYASILSTNDKIFVDELYNRLKNEFTAFANRMMH
ncbi:LysR family transcriptional regulator [Lacicoccus alkaliphilus]|uniref:Regulatory helix-turn-helix protein, lysR family n=1 Tax=Lacicoccus alkaliphilus DSM 16010 TaxID=1123231 RepID=A0A1M7KB61_9BACL|nr:LysR family transcriptional regulator [Salinicoccus alkaliphilus]SHM62474.1 regulatory helix-turn-helix protein, lysR family [Salinicoccus alkaliphilus DSM 16010]